MILLFLTKYPDVWALGVGYNLLLVLIGISGILLLISLFFKSILFKSWMIGLLLAALIFLALGYILIVPIFFASMIFHDVLGVFFNYLLIIVSIIFYLLSAFLIQKILQKYFLKKGQNPTIS